MMMDLSHNPNLFHDQHDLAPQVLKAVHGRHREVAFLITGAVAEIRLFILSRVPDSFPGIDIVVAEIRPRIEADITENVELRLRPPVGHVADAGRGEVFLRFLRDIARIAGERLERQRITHGAGQIQRRHIEQRIQEGGCRIRENQHVTLLDLGETPDA
jgi:hypothetical protein